MAQGRMLSKTISIDPEFNRMSVDARELFCKSIPHLDRDGLITGHPSKLWALIDPFHADRLDRMGEYIQEWVDANLTLRYDVGQPILFFLGFRKNNVNIPYDHESPSAYPPPPGWRRTRQGMIPEDPNLRLLLAEKLDPRSGYRKALVDPEPLEQAFKSRLGRDQVATTSRPGREEDQDQDQHAVADQINTPSPVRVIGVGGVGEGGLTHLLQFPDATLREAARQMGPIIFGADWRGDYEEYIQGAAIETVIVLLEWIQHFTDADYDSYASIRSLPAYVRECVNRGSRAGLTTKQQQLLLQQVARIHMPY